MGKTICSHSKRKDRCRECKKLGVGGNGICQHGIDRYSCHACGGSSICEHHRNRHSCSLCKPELMYKIYIRNARRRGESLVGFMVLEEFLELIKRNCWFCDRTPEQAKGM